MSDPNNPPPDNPYGDPAPSNPYGQPTQPPASPNPYGQAGPPAQPPAYGQQPYGAASYGAADPDKRPGTVTAASIITIVFSAVGVVGFAILAAVVQGSDSVFDEINREIEGQPGLEDYTADDILNFVTVALVVCAIWSLIALVLAVFAMRRQNWARILTVISAVVSALCSLISILSIVSVIPLIAAIAATILFFTGGANDWYRRKNAPPQQPVGTTQPWG